MNHPHTTACTRMNEREDWDLLVKIVAHNASSWMWEHEIMSSSGLIRIVLRIGRPHILRICLCIWTWFVPCFIVSFIIWTLSVYVEYSGHRHTDLHHHLLLRTREIEWPQTASTLISSPFWQYGGSVRRAIEFPRFWHKRRGSWFVYLPSTTICPPTIDKHPVW